MKQLFVNGNLMFDMEHPQEVRGYVSSAGAFFTALDEGDIKIDRAKGMRWFICKTNNVFLIKSIGDVRLVLN